jgi:hypothetical protein
LLLSLFGDPKTLWEARCPSGTANLLRLTFHPHGARPLIKNSDEVGPLLLQRGLLEALVTGGDTHEFIKELRNDSTTPEH